jgi:D-3-phosphoglycerate dehydrogenase / 2-oxoglutarate reductase
MSPILAAWGAFLRPSFDEVLTEAGVEIVPIPGEVSPAEVAPNCDALYVRLPQYASEEVIGALPNLKVLAVPGAGLEVIDIDAATRHGIPVLSGRGMGHEAVADWTLASMLWLTRHVGEMHEALRTGDWKQRFEISVRRDLHKLTVGLIGYGQIGARVATILATGFGSRVLVFDTAEGARDAARDAGLEVADLATLLRESDILSIHAQAKHGERPLIGKAELDAMKPGAMLVNTARGALLDYPSIVAALEVGTLAGAALDVFDQEPPQQSLIDRLTAHSNVLVSPHQAGMTIDATDSLAYGVASSVVDVLSGRQPNNCANPEVWAEQEITV